MWPINKKKGFVYLILMYPGVYKIGFSKHPKERAKQIGWKDKLNTRLIGTMVSENALKSEIYYHEKFDVFRVEGHGELFRFGAIVEESILSCFKNMEGSCA